MSTITFIAGTVGGSTNSSSITTIAIDTTGANLIVISVSSYASAAPTDSKSNTWLPLTIQNSGSAINRLFYCINPIVGSGHTFTINTASSYPVISVVAAASAGPWIVQGESGTFAVVTTIQPGSLTPLKADSLFVTGVTSNGDAEDINSSFTRYSIFSSGGARCSGGIGYKIKTTIGAENPTWDCYGVQTVCVTQVVFLSASPVFPQVVT